MIRLRDMTPEVYYQESRDFQFIGRLYDLILNYAKTNADQIYSLPLSDDSNSKLIDLMTMTLGFKSKHNYNIQQLTALCSAFAEIIKLKGTYTAIETACFTLFNSEGITEEPMITIDTAKATVTIKIPEKLSDVNLLKDLLIYIVPAGMTVNIIRTNLFKTAAATKGIYKAKVEKWTDKKDFELSAIVDAATITDTETKAKNKAGFFVNTTVIKPIPSTDADNNGGNE